MPEDTNTAIAGADPANKGQGSDSPTGDKKDAGTDSSPEVVLDKEGKPLPWNDQPKWKEARKAEKKLNDLLKANDLEDPDDLLELVQSGKAVKGKLPDLNALDSIVAKAAKLDQYEEYWAKQRKDQADPEQRAEIAEQELAKERALKAHDQQIEKTKKAISAYEKDVQGQVEEANIPKEYRGIVLELFGVGNPSNEVDITDKKATKKLVADGLKKFDAVKQAIIAEYLATKKNVVKTGQGAESVGGDQEKPLRTLKDMRRAFGERLKMGAGG
jgi:hypothetical protein